MQKWADKEGSSALAVWKGFVFVLVFEFSVATRHIHDNLEKITFSTNIWTFPELMTNTEITYILQNLQLDCRIYPSIVLIRAIWRFQKVTKILKSDVEEAEYL